MTWTDAEFYSFLEASEKSKTDLVWFCDRCGKTYQARRDGKLYMLCEGCFGGLEEELACNQPEYYDYPAKYEYELATIPYADFLRTRYWKNLRERVFKERGRKCERCNRTTYLQVHHLTYERRGRERMEDLEILCRDCHKQEHNITEWQTVFRPVGKLEPIGAVGFKPRNAKATHA